MHGCHADGERLVDPPSPSFESYGGAAPRNYERYSCPQWPRPLAVDLVEAASLTPSENVLDLACGTGVVARLAAERLGTATIEAVDVNPAMIDVARSVEASSLISWHQASAEALPFPDRCLRRRSLPNGAAVLLGQAARPQRGTSRPAPSRTLRGQRPIAHSTALRDPRRAARPPRAARRRRVRSPGVLARRRAARGTTRPGRLRGRHHHRQQESPPTPGAARLPMAVRDQYATRRRFAGLDETARRDFARDVVGGVAPVRAAGTRSFSTCACVLASAVAP